MYFSSFYHILITFPVDIHSIIPNKWEFIVVFREYSQLNVINRFSNLFPPYKVLTCKIVGNDITEMAYKAKLQEDWLDESYN